MDATTSGTPTIQYHNLVADQTIATAIESSTPQTFQRQVRQCLGESTPGDFPLAASPSIVLHVLTACNLDPQDLAKLEVTCSFFRHPAKFAPDYDLSIAELAALDLCHKRAIFRPMSPDQREHLKLKCGGSWKLVLRYLLAGEACSRREMSQAIAGPGHSIAVTSKGAVFSFGSNSLGQLGHGGPATEDGDAPPADEFRPRPIRSLQGIRIIQAAVGAGRTMLVSDTGRVYAFGKESFGESEYGAQGSTVNTPQLVESLKDIFVVQAAIGNFFTAVLSREGRVYTFSWGSNAKLGHQTGMALSVSTAFVPTKDHHLPSPSPSPALSLVPTRKPPQNLPISLKHQGFIPCRRSISVSAISSSPGVGSSTIEALDEIIVLDLEGNSVVITDLWKDRKAVVAFARHFGCVFCRKRADYLATKKELMDAAGVALVLIGPGNIDQARVFSQQTKFRGEVYADPNQSAYSALKFVSGASTTFTPKAGLKIIELYMEGYRQDWKLTFEKETVEKGGWQQGGVLVAGPGKDSISYVFKDKEAGDEPPIEDVLKACCA